MKKVQNIATVTFNPDFKSFRMIQVNLNGGLGRGFIINDDKISTEIFNYLEELQELGYSIDFKL